MWKKEAFRLKLLKFRRLGLAEYRKVHLKSNKFTIISNNCWGGMTYECYGLQKQSPTVGLFFMAADYIKFVKKLKYYISQPLEFISTDESKWKTQRQSRPNWGTYPIGKLADIEVHFLHYCDSAQATEKWNRRIERIHWNRMLIKFNDQNGCTEENLREFSELNYPNTICFTAHPHPDITGIFYIKNAHQYKEIPASYEPYGKSKYVDITKVLNNLQETK